MTLSLLSLPAYPAPPGADMHEIRVGKKISLRAAHWPPTTVRVRGTLCLLQGRAEFIEKYFETIAELRQRGFHVVAFDWRGQGRSSRMARNPFKGHVSRFEDYLDDLDAVHKALLETLPKPHFALAHSMGAAIALLAARRKRLPFERLVALAPMIRLSITNHQDSAAWLSSLLCWMGLGKCFIPFARRQSISLLPFAGNRLSSDPARYERNALLAKAMEEGAIGDPTIGWVRAACRWMALFQEPRCALEITTPTLILAPAQDRVVSTPATERFASRLKAGHALILGHGGHEILQETDAIRDQFWAAFDAFIPGSSRAELMALQM